MKKLPDVIQMRGWERWQSYRRDRGKPPWIKVWRRLMLDPNWIMLSDSERGQLVSMWLVAADRDGQLPHNPEMIRKICQLEKAPNIQRFIELGFVELDVMVDVKVTSRRRHADVNVSTDCPASSDNQVSLGHKQSQVADDAGTPAAPGPTPGEIPIATWSQESDECTRQLVEAICANDHRARIPDRTSRTWQTWCTDMDKINRIDGRSWPEIQSIIAWCQRDDFWRANILSPGKLRKQFPQLLHQSKRNGRSTSNADTYERMLADGIIKRDS